MRLYGNCFGVWPEISLAFAIMKKFCWN